MGNKTVDIISAIFTQFLIYFMEIEYLKIEDIDEAYKFINKFSKEVGFVIKPSFYDKINKKESIIIKDNDKIIALCNFHKRKDNISVIYEIAVDKEYRNQGLAKKMIRFLIEKGHNIILKCPVDNESNNFYRNIGSKFLGTIKGRKRDLNVWNININHFNF